MQISCNEVTSYREGLVSEADRLSVAALPSTKAKLTATRTVAVHVARA